MAQTFLYCRPDEITSYFGSVVSAGVDDDYDANSLVGGWPGTPTRWAAAGAITGTISMTAGEVGLVAVVDHNLPAGTVVTFGGDITATATTPTPTPPNGIPLNPFTTITPVAGVDSVTFSFNSGATVPVIGEIILAKYRTLTRPTLRSDTRGMMDFTRQQPSDKSSIAPYDPGLDARAPWQGEFLLTTTELDNVIAWFQSQRNGTRPSLIVPDTSVNDAWVGFLSAPQYRPLGPAFWKVSLSFTELKRGRW